MTTTNKHEMAQRLRSEAEDIRQHGMTNFFEHTYACLRYGQSVKMRSEDRCGPCPIRTFVPADYTEEAFPCQHVEEKGWDLAAQQPDLAEQYVSWLLRTADQLDAEANKQA